MTSQFPDVALNQPASHQLPLDWVGMRGIDLPLWLDEPEALHPHASVEAQVNLPEAHIKGIHMSRIYRTLDAFAEYRKLTPAAMRGLLQEIVASHADCSSTAARVVFEFNALRRRAALVTENFSGWRSYPVRIEAVLERGRVQIEMAVTILYSSTCPCSAALARQVVQQAFLAHFGAEATLTAAQAAAWIESNATLATPHSQRSEALVTLRLPPEASRCGLFELIDEIEAALGTPVQAAVKRADERAFAELNGGNLMYVEDAARKLQSALSARHENFRISVRHRESLHPHDAVAHVLPASAAYPINHLE